MSEDQELSRLEKDWRGRLDRYTSPEPTSEQSFQLIARIKASEQKPADPRAELEAAQAAQSTWSKLANLFRSQWNFYGMRSWLLTGVIMLLLTIMIHWGSVNEAAGLLAWIKWTSLVLIAVIGYAFRSKNKGNDIIELLSFYPLAHQMFARFIIVMALQLTMTLALSFLILGEEVSLLNVLGSFTPLIFFGVVGFASAMWLGYKTAVVVTLFVWFSQMVLDQGFQSPSLFQLPWHEQYLLMNAGIWGLSILLLGSVLLKHRLKRDFQ